MAIITKVKGYDDFGKRILSGHNYEYEHHYPRVNKGDILVYYYPKDNAMGIYIAGEETEYYNKDGFQYCKGDMVRCGNSPLDALNNIKSQNTKLGEQLENVMNEIAQKYQSK